MHKRHAVGAFLGLVFAGVVAAISVAAQPAVPDFCFLQVSDIHLSPRPAGSAESEDGRSAETIRWVCEQAKVGQRIDLPAMLLPAPGFVIATGDLTEYGVIGKTWDHFEACFKPLGLPLYIVPGNHDNTWTSIMPVMRKRQGADNYSFEQYGCHFVGLDSATIQEPLPNLEARTLNWLREDLGKVDHDEPVCIFQHHPLSTDEFATPLEQLRFLEVVREHHVALLLMGHGHGVRAERWNTVDSVMGGSTFGPNAGYNIVSVVNGVLRVVYRYEDQAKPMQKLLEKPLARAETSTLELLAPGEGAVIGEAAVSVAVRVRGATPGNVTADIDGRKENQTTLTEKDGQYSGSIATEGLLAGFHYVQVKAAGVPGETERAVSFLFQPGASGWRTSKVVLSSGMQAGPVPVEGGWLVATTDGRVLVAQLGDEPAAPAGTQPARPPRGVCKTGVEIIHAPMVVDGAAYFSSAELGVYSVNLDGKLNWKRPVGAAVYGTPAVVGDGVYVGDMEGFVHAIDRKTGELKWSKRQATFGIEMGVVADRGVLYLGAWDGLVYAVNAADGSLKWKQPGPGGHMPQPGLHSRYYAPADCPPVVIGERVFICDRSYRLGSYALDGKYMGLISEDAAAIGLTEDGQGLYARGFKGIVRYDGEGKAVWSQPLTLGRFPCPPTAWGGRVYVCSDLGVLHALDAADGKVLWQYQASPRLHVMAPVGTDASGSVCVAGMDGSLLSVSREK